MPSYQPTQHHLLLEEAAARIVRRLGGIWSSDGGMCRCPAHHDRSPSLSVRVGHSAILYKCFAGCDTHEVIAAIRAERLLPPRVAFRGETPHRFEPSDRGRPPDRGGSAARRLWAEASVAGRGLAAAYLESRHIRGVWPGLGFHPFTPLGKGAAVVRRPALLAAVRDDCGVRAVQRSFLDADGRLARDLVRPRRLLGTPGIGAVRLAPAASRLGLAEGWETGLSAMIVLGLPVWAALGTERFGQVAIPDTVEQLVLLPDNDAAGDLAEARARIAYRRPGLSIIRVRPPLRFNDWNDLHRAGVKWVGEGRG
jgi:putative DNA primase/helicase